MSNQKEVERKIQVDLLSKLEYENSFVASDHVKVWQLQLISRHSQHAKFLLSETVYII